MVSCYDLYSAYADVITRRTKKGRAALFRENNPRGRSKKMKNLTDIPLGWKRKLTPAQLSEVSILMGKGLTRSQASYHVLTPDQRDTYKAQTKTYLRQTVENSGATKGRLYSSRSYARRCGHLPVDPATVWPYPVDGKCELCGYGGSKKQLHMDHDHLTGQFRAWLCSNCNAKIAWVERVGLGAVNQFLAGR